jgi:hypothetical protein
MHLIMQGFILISILHAGCHAIDSLDQHERKAQIRFYNKAGCFQGNEGELGIYNREISTCRVTSEGYIESLRIEHIEDGCYCKSFCSLTSLFSIGLQLNHIFAVHIYNDLFCRSPPEVAYSHACFSGPGGIGGVELLCPSLSSGPDQAVAR